MVRGTRGAAGGSSMSSVRNWRVGSLTGALIASGDVALLVVIVAAMPIDLLMNMERLWHPDRRDRRIHTRIRQRPLFCCVNSTRYKWSCRQAQACTLAQ